MSRRRILLINPNSSTGTTAMMVDIAASEAGLEYEVAGATARRSPAMIVAPEELHACAVEVLEIARANEAACAGLIVAAFGDPGLAQVRAHCRIPSAGIGESSMLEAAAGGRRFGVATTTPALAEQINALPQALGLAAQYTGPRFTHGDPHELTRDPFALRASLAEAVQKCIECDRAEAVIIGGGPLGQAAIALQPLFGVPIIAPIPAAVARLRTLLVAARR